MHCSSEFRRGLRTLPPQGFDPLLTQRNPFLATDPKNFVNSLTLRRERAPKKALFFVQNFPKNVLKRGFGLFLKFCLRCRRFGQIRVFIGLQKRSTKFSKFFLKIRPLEKFLYPRLVHWIGA